MERRSEAALQHAGNTLPEHCDSSTHDGARTILVEAAATAWFGHDAEPAEAGRPGGTALAASTGTATTGTRSRFCAHHRF